MIILRNKSYGNIDDGFKGKKGDIKRVNALFRKSDSYKKDGPWEVEFSERADEELNEFSENLRKRIRAIKEELEHHPYEGNYGQHPLWEFYDTKNECVVWSAEINEKNRLNYLIFKQQNYILVTNLIGHNVIDIRYNNRPKI